jgi:uncharacterized protein YyaL (SSP411 family)
MAHESFSDPDVAVLLNANFVPVKVDREERPDVDAVYMSATTAMTGQGGWPMTCLLTPDGDPFYAGTYFPKQQFLQLLAAATEAWAERREDVTEAGSRVVTALQRIQAPPEALPLTADDLAGAESTLYRTYDSQRGGFADAPKFPPAMVCEFLLRHHARTDEQRPLQMVDTTFEAMARGGIYDQLAGGFARYSVDAGWVIPHFEKMLYDNALLLRVYLHLWRVTRSALARRVAAETAQFLLADLRTPEGGFASALDADTDGREGLTYVWTPTELGEVLGPADGARAAEIFGVTASGTFEHGTSTLQLRQDPDHPEWFAGIRARLLDARRRRPQPARDDKVVSSWNGLAVGALAEAGILLRDRRYIAAAEDAARLLTTTNLVDGRLRRTSRDGTAGSASGGADDYGNLAEGLLVLHQAVGDPRWLRLAGDLLDTAIDQFSRESGGFYDAPADADALFVRPADPADNASPAGQSALAGALLMYSALTGSTRHRGFADRAVEAAGRLAMTEPRFAGWTLAVAEALIAGPVQVAIVAAPGRCDDADTLREIAWSSPSPGLVTVSGTPDQAGMPLLASRPLLDGQPAAYVCRGFVCDRPVSEVGDLQALLRTA